MKEEDEEVQTLPTNILELGDVVAARYENYLKTKSPQSIREHDEAISKYNQLAKKPVFLTIFQLLKIQTMAKKSAKVVAAETVPTVEIPTLVTNEHIAPEAAPVVEAAPAAPVVEVPKEPKPISSAQTIRNAWDADRDGFEIKKYVKETGKDYGIVYRTIKHYAEKLGVEWRRPVAEVAAPVAEAATEVAAAAPAAEVITEETLPV